MTVTPTPLDLAQVAAAADRTERRLPLFRAVRSPVALPPIPAAGDTLACRDCGAAVRGAMLASVERVTLDGFRVDSVATAAAGAPVYTRVSARLATCEVCAARRVRAEAIVDGHPRFVATRGGGLRAWSVEAAHAVLVALDVLGYAGDRSEALTATDRDLMLGVELLAEWGPRLTWRAKVRRELPRSDEPNDHAAVRWGHVPAADRRALRAAFAGLLRRRIEQPIPVSPPAGAMPACVLCGVATVVAKPSNAATVWGTRRTVELAPVGGHGRMTGYACPDCRALIEAEAWGPTATERSLLATLKLRLPWNLRGGDLLDVLGVKPWVAVQTDAPEGNVAPWSHTDLRAIGDALRQAGARSATVGR